MRRIPIGIMLAALGWSSFAQSPALPTTTTIQVEWIALQSNWCSAYFTGERHVTFEDTVGPDWTDLTIRIPMQTSPRPANQEPFPTVTVAINGVPVGSPVAVFNRASCWTNLQFYEFRTSLLPGYQPFGMNTFSIYAAGYDVGGPPAQLIFTSPPATFSFDFAAGQQGARMLIHKYRADDSYPSLYQMPTAAAQPPRFRFPGVVNVDGRGTSRPVWFRVIDPPDPSPYIPADRRGANDNKDGQPKGVLMSAGCTAVNCHAANGQSLKLLSSASGRVDLVLEATSRYAGDNYQIEASLDASFSCATAGVDGRNVCARSGIVTAWKRVYVEAHKMLTTGAFLTADVPEGATELRVSNVRPFPAPPFQLRLLHAAPAEGGSPKDFYSEEVTVRHVLPRASLFRIGPAPGVLYLRHPAAPDVGDIVTRRYSGPEPVGPLRDPREYLADAVGLVTGTSDDYFDADATLIPPLFDQAYIDYFWVPDESGRQWSNPSYSRVIPSIPKLEYNASEWLARKWMRNAFRFSAGRQAFSNHQMLFFADRSTGDGQRGLTRVSGGFNDLWLFAGALPNRQQRSEALTHEMGHQWRVNDRFVSATPATSQSTEGHATRRPARFRRSMIGQV